MSSDVPAPDPVPPAPEPLPSIMDASPVLRWLSTSNPFYVISAALFLLGLRMSFGAHVRDLDSWALMGGLAGYTLLLAAAALVLVRFARVWNDVRTVLLLVVLMFLATSVTFDELLVLDPDRGRWFFVGGLVFSVALTEGLLRGIGLRFPLLFRVPYHLTLALFFLYPLLLAPLTRDPHSESLLWGLWGFSPAAGLIFLTLLPAIRRGPDYTRDNGSPWWWPYYPWSAFVFLAFAVCARAFLLCWSFHLLPSPQHLVFGPYFLAPFGLALAVLVLELGLVARNRVTQLVALALPLGLAVLSGVGHRSDPIYREFLGHFAARLGAMPLLVGLVAACAFYLYAWARRVPTAAEFLTAAVAALAVTNPGALALRDLTAPHPGPLVAAAALQVWVWLWRREWWRMALGAAVVVLWGGSVGWGAYAKLREDVAGLDYIVLSLVLLPIAVLISLAKGGALERWRDRPPAPST